MRSFDATDRRPAHDRRASKCFRLFLVAALLFPALTRAQSDLARQVEARIFVLVNELRAAHGLKRLEREARLDATADYFGEYLAATDKLDHLADGNTPAMRVRQRGYGYCAIAENIGYEYDSRGFTPERLARNFVDGWRDSPTHRANMLNPALSQTGIGVARNAKNEYYAVQIFGRPVVPGATKGAACPRQTR